MLRLRRWSAPSGSSILLQRLQLGCLWLVLLAIAYRYFLSGRFDPDKCASFLSRGSWSNATRHPFERWKPSECVMHEYDRDEFRDCLIGRRVVFVGDSTVRQLYWAAANRLDHTQQEIAALDFHVSKDKQRDLSLKLEGVELEFFWDPWLNSTALRDELANFEANWDVEGHQSSKLAGKDPPGLIIIGAPGLWAARHGGGNFMELFRSHVDPLRRYLRGATTRAPSAQGVKDRAVFDGLPDRLLLAPVAIPLYDRLSPSRAATLTPRRIASLNDYLHQTASSDHSYILSAFNAMTKEEEAAYDDDGVHVVKNVRERQITMALNVRCNPGLKRDLQHQSPTCCVSYPGLGMWAAFLLVNAVFALISLTWNGNRESHLYSAIRIPDRSLDLPKDQQLRLRGKIRSAQHAFSLFFGVASLPYLTHSTHLFVKVPKFWQWLTFSRSLLAFVILSTASLRFDKGSAKIPEPRFLPYRQAAEWKGWMQAIILLYSYYGDDSSLTPYKLSRLSMAVYIFLSTYGHATYFLRTNDVSLSRFLHVLARLNLLNAVLGTTATHRGYHFPEVVSFWFVIVFLTFRIASSSNNNASAVLLKSLAVALGFSRVLLSSEVSGALVRAQLRSGLSSLDNEGIRSSLLLDRYTPFFGMLTAVLVHRITALRNHHATPNTGPFKASADALDEALRQIIEAPVVKKDEQSLRPILILSSILTLFFLTSFTLSKNILGSTAMYDDFHPYLSPIIICGLIYLRNCTPALKRAYLALPAALGPIALETYLLKNHIWMVSEGKGVLAIWAPGELGAFLAYIQFIILTIALLWIAGRAREATRGVTDLLFLASKEKEKIPFP